ncbi:IS256 family transposase [Pontiellaceae bacterium B12219]|nr:IS256 family transposase [Pontiellaceae bacterium B12219]
MGSGQLGHANGYKPKNVRSRLGNLALQIPQVRGGIEFYPSALEKGERSERALKLSMAQMYIEGVTTRKVSSVLESMCGLSFSSSDVSRATALLDEELEKWRTRPLGRVEYLILDARYEKVRMNGSVVSCAVLVATGVLADGKRSVLGVSVSMSEAEIHWREFMLSLKKRGMHGVKLVTSDEHAGLQSALQSALPGVPVQRCQVHLQRNAQAYIPKADMREGVAADIRTIFNAPDKEEAERLLSKTVEKYRNKAARLAVWMEENLPDGFAIFAFPAKHRRRLRTTNMVERQNREIRRRTRVSGLFPNEAALLRLVSAILMEVSEEWESADKAYLKLKTD